MIPWHRRSRPGIVALLLLGLHAGLVAADAAPVITEGGETTVTMSEDAMPTAFRLTLHATDVDTDDTLTWSIRNAANHGLATVSGTGSRKTITYVPAADHDGQDRFTVQVKDDDGATDTIVVQVVIQAVNDPPVIAEGGQVTVTMSEDATPTAFHLTLHATDVEGRPITWSISSPAGPGTASLAPGDPGAGQEIRYLPPPGFAGLDGFTVQADDGDGGTAAIDVQVIIAAVNDAPRLDAALVPALAALREDAPVPVGTAGTLVADLVVLGGDVSDGDADARTGLAVVGTTGRGTWYWADDDGWHVLAPSVVEARLLAPTARLSYHPARHEQGAAVGSITFHAWDQTTGAAGGTADLGAEDATGGSTAFSTASATLDMAVLAVNDAPTFTAGPDVVVEEDGGHQVLSGWATDLDAGGGDPQEAGQALRVTVIADTRPALFAIPPTVAADGTLEFTLAPEANGVATVTLRLEDDGGTDQGGRDTSADHAFTITVLAINDAPSMTMAAKTLTDPGWSEDTTLTITWADLRDLGGDADLGETAFTSRAFETMSFRILGLGPGATLRDDADRPLPAPTAAVPVVVAAGGGVRWRGPADAHGLLEALRVQVVDAAGAVSATTATVSVVLAPVDDAPSLAWWSTRTGLELGDASADDGAVRVDGDPVLEETHDINGGSTALLIDRTGNWTMRMTDPDAGGQATDRSYDDLAIAVTGRAAQHDATGAAFTSGKPLAGAVGHTLLLRARSDLQVVKVAVAGLPWSIRVWDATRTTATTIAGCSGAVEIIDGTEALTVRFTGDASSSPAYGLSFVAGHPERYDIPGADAAARTQELVLRVLRAIGYINLCGAAAVDPGEAAGLFTIALHIPGSQDGLVIRRLLRFQIDNHPPLLTASGLRVRPGQFLPLTVSTDAAVTAPVIGIDDDQLADPRYVAGDYGFLVTTPPVAGRMLRVQRDGATGQEVYTPVAAFTLEDLQERRIGYRADARNQMADLVGLVVSDPLGMASARANLAIAIDLLDLSVPQVGGDPLLAIRVPAAGTAVVRQLTINRPQEWSLPFALRYVPVAGGEDPHLALAAPADPQDPWCLVVRAAADPPLPCMAGGRIEIHATADPRIVYSSWPVTVLLVPSASPAPSPVQ